MSRYGLSLLGPAAGDLAAGGWHIDVVAHPEQADRARHAVTAVGQHAEMQVVENAGFVRSSPFVHALAARADLYYTSHYLLDRLCPVPFVVTIHDVTRLRWPQLSYSDDSFTQRFGSAELDTVRHELVALDQWRDPRFTDHDTFTRYFAAVNQFLIARAARVVTVSRSAAKEIDDHLGSTQGGVSVVPGGVDADTFRPRTAAEIGVVRTRFGLGGPFLVFVGLAHPHKRLDWLVDHLLAARARMPAGARLVAVGGHAEKIHAVQHRLAEAGAAGFVVFTGHISDDALAALYSGAAALVSASLSEGYGLPVQEALSCGCEVIAADLPVHRETAGPAVHRYPSHRGAAMAELTGAALHGRIRQRNIGNQAPSWQDACRDGSSSTGWAPRESAGHGRTPATRAGTAAASRRCRPGTTGRRCGPSPPGTASPAAPLPLGGCRCRRAGPCPARRRSTGWVTARSPAHPA
ncbi:MAG: glycosyltransferase [Pseudonocardia sp.]